MKWRYLGGVGWLYRCIFDVWVVWRLMVEGENDASRGPLPPPLEDSSPSGIGGQFRFVWGWGPHTRDGG